MAEPPLQQTGQTEESGQPPVLNIVGERMALGPLCRSLVSLYQRWVNNFETQRTLGNTPRPQTHDAITTLYERGTAAINGAQFTIYEKTDLRPIGITELKEIDHRNRTAEYVIFIGEPEARGRGYGTEVTRLMLDYAFTALGLHNVLLTVFEFNLGARRAYEKAGFKEIGRRRQAFLMGGRYWDVIYMDCLASEFTSPLLARVFRAV